MRLWKPHFVIILRQSGLQTRPSVMNMKGSHGCAHALSRRAVALVDRALDARGDRRALRHPSAEPQRRRAAASPTILPSIRWARCRRSGTATWSSPRRRRSAPISRTHFPRQAERADRRSAPRRLSQVAVLRPGLHRAGDDRPRVAAQGRGAPRHARLRRFRHRDERGGARRSRKGPTSWASSSPPPTS